jgi:hypothetical protein
MSTSTRGKRPKTSGTRRPAEPSPRKPDPAPARVPEVEKPAVTAARATPHREKLVKGSFRMPRDDYALIAVLKQRGEATGARPRKNDLLRAGLHALMESGRVELRRALDRLPPMPRGATRRKKA